MDKFRIPQGSTEPPVTHQLTRDVRGQQRPVDIEDPSKTVQFFMRRQESSTLLIAAAPAAKDDAAAGVVSYSPASGDFADDGLYRAWFRLLTGGTDPEDFDEFEILVFAHSYGEGTALGSIARAARAQIPIAWDALRRLPEYGDIELQRVVETNKLYVLNATVGVNDEAALDPRVIDYISKKVAIDLCEPAIQYWMDQIVSQSTPRGEGEVHTFPDRITATEKQKARLEAAVAKLGPQIQAILGSSPTFVGEAPGVDQVGEMITPNLDEFPDYWHGRSRVPSEPITP